MIKTIAHSGLTARVEIRDEADHIEKHWLLSAFYEGNAIGLLTYIQCNYPLLKSFYDIGASIGNHTLFFSEIMEHTEFVLAVEPYSPSYEHLLANIEHNKRARAVVKPIRIAIGAEKRSGDMNLYGPCNLDPDCPHSSNVGMSKFTEGFHGETAMVTLDELARTHDLPPPDFIKFDIEGFELEALAGAKATIADHKPVISIEIEPVTDLELFDDWMSHIGYLRESEKLNYTPTFIYESEWT